MEEDVTEPTTTVWASPIVSATKTDGSLRFCISHLDMNALTLRDSYPLHSMNKCIDLLGEARIFLTSGKNSIYWQVK